MRQLARAGRLSLPLAAAVLVQSCKTTQGASGVASAAGSSDTSFQTLATAAAGTLQAKYNPYEIQSFSNPPQDCRTIITPADPSVPFRGTAVFFHGHTACPQQYYELSQILAKKGVQTFAPLMPGQGRAPQPDPSVGKINGMAFKDYYGEFLPKVQNNGWQALGTFVDDVNAFVATLPGDHFVAGLSVGGMLATYAYVSQPNLYKNALLIDPYYGMPGTYLGWNEAAQGFLSPLKAISGDSLYYIEKEVLDYASQAITLVADRAVSWGASCYSQTKGLPNSVGRAGICDFRFDNLAAVDAFGKNFFANYLLKLPPSSSTSVQYIMREFDDGANTLLTRKAEALQQKAWGSNQVKICTNPNSIPHSFFARADIIAVTDPYWLNAFLKNATNNLAYGTPVPTDSSASSQEVVMDPVTFKDTSTFFSRCDATEMAYSDVYLTPQ